jgi:peroxiredoxin
MTWLALSSAFYVSYGAMWVLLLVTATGVFLLFRHFGLVSLGSVEGVQRDGLPVGEPAPVVEVSTGDGRPVTWTPSPSTPTLLLFAAAGCDPCELVLPYAAHLMNSNGSDLDVVTIVSGRVENATAVREQLKLPFPCFAEAGGNASDEYRVRVTPFAFVIGDDRRIRAKGLCGTPIRLKELLAAGGLDETAARLDPLIERDAAERLAATLSSTGGSS